MDIQKQDLCGLIKGKENGVIMDIKDMFNQIEDYHKTLGYYYKNMSAQECLDNIRHTGLALYQEVGELIDSFPWKPWRPIKDQPSDEYNAAIEIVDILFFLGAIRAAASIAPETIEALFDYKLRENYDRIKRGYNNKPEDRG